MKKEDVFGSTKEIPRSIFPTRRSCTDIFFLLLFVVSFGGFLSVMLVAKGKGASPQRILHGVNLQGITCGKGVMSDKPYNAWIAMPTPSTVFQYHKENPTKLQCSNCFHIRTCLADCSETMFAPEMIDLYPSDALGYYCLPNTKNITNIGNYLNDFVSEGSARGMADLYTTWPILLVSVFIALAFSFLYNYLSESIAGVLVFLAILVISVCGFLSSYFLIQSGKEANKQYDKDDMRGTAMIVMGILFGILSILFVCMIYALRHQIRIAIEIVKEANRCIHDVWTLFFFPLFPMLVGIGYIVLWIIACLYTFSAWTSSYEVLPDYIQYGDRFDSLKASGLLTYNSSSNMYLYTSYAWNKSMQKPFIYIVFHLLWTAQFHIYFAYLVMSGVIAQWYFEREGLRGSPVTESCFRSLRYHLGTVAIASLIIAITQSIRGTVNYIEKKFIADNNCIQKVLFCVLKCMLSCIQSCLDKINRYALVWTAIWGDSFGTAACSSFRVMWNNIGRTGAFSIVSSFLLFLGKITVAMATAGIGTLILRTFYGDRIHSMVIPVLIIVIIGYIVGSLFLAVFEVALDTVFFCFLVDEKLHARDGTMFAGESLRSLVEKKEMKELCNQHAIECQEQTERRNKYINE